MSRSNSDYLWCSSFCITHIPLPHPPPNTHTAVLPQTLLPGKKNEGLLFCSLLPTVCLDS